MVEKQNLCIVNGQSNKCEGVWTREQGEEKSVKDFVIPTKRDLNTIKTMKIDEEKLFEIYKVERQGTKQSRKIYSDHNGKYSIHQQNGSKRLEKIITKKGYQKYKKFIKERQISKIIKKGTLQESYNKWTEEVEDAIKQVQKTVRKNPRKDIRELQKIRKNLRIKIRNTTDACEKIILKARLKLLKEHITDKIKESWSNQIKQIAESISNWWL